MIGWLFVYGWYLSISLTFYLSIALSIYLSHFLSIYLTFYISFSIWPHKIISILWFFPSPFINIINIVKNVSSFTSHNWNCKTLKLRNFTFFLSSTFNYEKIKISKSSFFAIYFCLKLLKNVNIMKTQIFH